MSPTITVASFFSVRPQNVCVVDTFYRTTKSTEPASGITSELLQRVPPFVHSIFNVRYRSGRDYRVPPLNFFRHCATFFSNFLLSPNGPPSSFLIFCSKLKFQKAQRVPLSSFSALWDFQNSHFSFFWIFFKKFSNFSFVAKRSPLQVFWYFAANRSFKKPKGSPLSSFRHCETVSKFSFFVFSKVFSKKFRIFLLSPIFFWYFATDWIFKKLKGSPPLLQV